MILHEAKGAVSAAHADTYEMVGRLGLEPRTNTLKGYCSTN